MAKIKSDKQKLPLSGIHIDENWLFPQDPSELEKVLIQEGENLGRELAWFALKDLRRKGRRTLSKDDLIFMCQFFKDLGRTKVGINKSTAMLRILFTKYLNNYFDTANWEVYDENK